MIKGGLFLKSLKQLFIIGLISCFTLLVGSSVSAYTCNYDISNYFCGDYLDFGQSNIFNNFFGGSVKDNKFNFYGSNDFIFTFNIPLNGVSFNALNYWRGRDGLYYSSRFSSGDSEDYGKINGFYVCSSAPGSSYNYLSRKTICTYNLGFDNLGQYISSSSTYKFYCNRGVPNSQNKDVNCIVCVCDGNCASNKQHICIDKSSKSSLGSSFVSSSQIVLGDMAGNNPIFNPWGGTSFNPSTGSRLGGRLITSSGYTNNQMVEAYECVGLQPALCYGGYPITDIFQPGENFEDFTGYTAGQGATIFDLYNRYSGSFSNINQFLNTVLTRYQNGQINSFITEPKALLMLGAQMNTAGLKTSYISTYCDLLLNKNNTSIYTGNSVDDLRAQSCYRSQHINDSLKNSDGSDIIGQGSDVGIFGSGDDVDFDPETFFSNMMEKISSGLDNVSTGTAVGIIPGYIILFTLALIFIRMISH